VNHSLHIQKIMSRFLHVTIGLILALAFADQGRAANIAGGYTNSFAAQPGAGDWSTFSIAGAAATLLDAGAVDAAVQSVSASSITTATTLDGTEPPAFNANATWASTGLYLQTRVTGNNATLLMCTLFNNLGVNAIGTTISYDFNRVLPAAEEIDGHRAFYSLTGAPGSWVPISQFFTATPQRLSVTLNLNWPNNTPLYIVWADDNGSGSPDTGYQIDNFSAIAIPGTQTPVTVTTQPVSQNVAELAPVTFTVGLGGYLPPTLQWYTNDVAIPGATSLSYHIPAVPLSYHGLNFKVIAQNVASNVTYYATSSVATLTVNADTVAPVILSAQPAGLNQLVVSFSERLAVGSATTLANYSITGPGGSLIISNAVLDATQTNVVLTVSTMTLATAYTLTVNGITDLSAAANTVAANSQVQFTAAAIAFVDIGGPAIGGSVTTAGSGYRISGGGTNMTGSSDQFTFAYQLVAGDFDNKVRLDSLTARDAYAMAGLMARETLDANSRFAASMASPSLSGCFILQRSVADTGTAFGNNFPVNYPHTWLRLTRVGNVFTAYGGFDGQTWVQLGTVTIAMPSSVYFGYAVCGANTSQAASVELRDISSGLGGTVVPSLTRSIEPLSVSSRRTGLVISEIMYNPRNRTDNKDLAFIEIFNADPIFEDLSGYRLGGDAGYTFPTGTVLQAGSFIVVAASPLDVQSEYGITGVYGPWTNALSNSGGTVRLRNALDAVLLEVNYETTAPWPLAADSAGHSLVLAQPSYGEDDSRAWAASDVIGGSPGRADSVSPEPLRNLVINEFLSRTVPPAEDFIELYNRGTTALDISGAWLSDSANTNKFRIPNGTVLPARGFAVFSETQLGFGLSSSGEKILLVSSNQNRVLDAWTFDSQDDAISSGRFPDGSVNIRELSALTPGAINAPPLQRSIVINELMFDPISGDEDDDYIELYNRGASTVNLGRWQFTAGVDYTFPANTLIAPGSYVVVAKNRNRMLANYANLNATNVFGNFDGSLRNNGERLALSMPDEIITTNGAVLAAGAGDNGRTAAAAVSS